MSFWQTIGAVFGDDRYLAHSLCLTNDPVIMTLYAASDLSTCVAYFAIGLSLLFRSANIIKLRPGSTLLYGAFIFLCGLSHLTMVITLFDGLYWLDLFIRAMMAAVSLVTAVYTVKDLLPDEPETARRVA